MTSRPQHLKIIVVGDSTVGKTSLMQRYCYDKFNLNITTTVNCDFNTKLIDNKDGEDLSIQLWDIAGQEKFRAISQLYVRGSLGCIIVCDIKSKKSLENVQEWYKLILDNCDSYQNKPIPILMVQNKCDLVSEDQRDDFQKIGFLQTYAKENGMIGVFQTSAKENIGIQESIQFLIDEIMDLLNQSDIQQRKLTKQKKKQSQNNCC